MYKIAHISDTHIKNLKYHYEYKVIFDKIYENLREEAVDYIVHCGDIAHTKTQISPEFVELCSDFLRNLADIAPTYVILGNHDGNLRNSQRQDAITPIVNALNHDDLFLLKDSQECHVNEDICLNVLSVFDEDNWKKPSNRDKINIALYHGAVKFSRTDMGYSLEHGDHDVSIFKDFDYAFLGDIHKTQFLDKKGRIAYAGSTIQQNFGETNDKGYLLWKITSKDEFECEKVIIPNPRPFITINLTKTGRLPNKFKCPPNARLRLVSDTNIPLEKLRKAVEVAKTKCKPESVTYLNRAGTSDLSVEHKVTAALFDDLRSEKTQQDLIKEYLKDFNPDKETLEEVYSLNSKYNKIAEADMNVARNVHWKIKTLKWDNLFNYGEGNQINFENLGGTIGIFGKNFSGKSSIIDALLFTIFNTTSKNIRKNYNIINQNKDTAFGEVEIEIGDKTYKIRRESEKYTKKLKGKETNEARTQVDFSYRDNLTGETHSLNKTERGATDKAIKSVLGDYEDFLYTTMSSQSGAMVFINEGSTKRKEILAKFLDLEFFEKKFRLAKEDASDLRGQLKRFTDRDFDSEIGDLNKSLFSSNADVIKLQNQYDQKELERDTISESLADIQQKLAQISEDTISKSEIDAGLSKASASIKECKSQIDSLDKSIDSTESFLENSKELINEIDITSLNENQEKIGLVEKQIEESNRLHEQLSRDLERSKQQIKTLNSVPCGDKYLTVCKFIKDASSARDNLEIAEKAISDLLGKISVFERDMIALDPAKTRAMLSNWSLLKTKIQEREYDLVKLKSKKQATVSTLDKSTADYDKWQGLLDYYKKHQDVLENHEKLKARASDLKKNKASIDAELKTLKEEIYSRIGKKGALEEKIDNLKSLKQEKEDLTRRYSAYDLFMTCMHSNGIAFDIIKKALPVLNSEISKVLANVVDFDVLFENSDNKLDILIKHDKYEPRPLENGSGAEKALAAIAIRIALLNTSNIPKSSVLILDEPGTSLDPDNMEGFVRILDLTKGYFDITLLITHVEALKDIVDMTIDIMKSDDGYAHVNQ